MKAPFNYRPGRFAYRRPAAPRLSVVAAPPLGAEPRPLLRPEPRPTLPQVA